jgi:phosphoenolpyruvate-protein kinase (PTS system EI component)
MKKQIVDVEVLQTNIERLIKQIEELKSGEKALEKRLEQREKRIEELEAEKKEWFDVEKNANLYSNYKIIQELELREKSYKELYEKQLEANKTNMAEFQNRLEKTKEKIHNERGAGRKAKYDIDEVIKLINLHKDLSDRKLSELLKINYNIYLSHTQINILKKQSGSKILHSKLNI